MSLGLAQIATVGFFAVSRQKLARTSWLMFVMATFPDPAISRCRAASDRQKYVKKSGSIGNRLFTRARIINPQKLTGSGEPANKLVQPTPSRFREERTNRTSLA